MTGETPKPTPGPPDGPQGKTVSKVSLSLKAARLLLRMVTHDGHLVAPPASRGGELWRVVYRRGQPMEVVDKAIGDELKATGMVDDVAGFVTEAGANALPQIQAQIDEADRKREKDRARKAAKAGDVEDPPPPPTEEVSSAPGGGGSLSPLFAAAKTYVPPDENPAAINPETGLRLDCPVEPLGAEDDLYYYLDARRQFRAVTDEKHGKSKLLGLFTPAHSWLYDHFPRLNDAGEVVGWRSEAVQERLMAACARKGLWSPRDRLRTVGSWTDDKGRLVLHLGDRVHIDGVRYEPGRHGEMVYSAAEAIFGPKAPDPGDPMTPGEELFGLLQRWNWRRPDLDPWLMMGWIVAAFLGGAVAFRPVVWVTGDKGTGKSTLQDVVLEHIMGRWLLRAANATAASLYQTKGNSSQPVAIDELEPNPDNEAQASAIIKLARIAASGGKLRRGGKDGQASEYPIQCAFFFSSILIPPLDSQDRSRLAELDLDELPAGASLGAIDLSRLRQVGAGLLHQASEGWARFQAVLPVCRAALARQGHKGRGCDVFGTLLAGAWIVLRQGVPAEDDDDLMRLTRQLNAESLAVLSGDRPDHEQCVYKLMTSMADQFRSGQRRTIAQYIHDAAYHTDYDVRATAEQALAVYGIKVILDRGSPDETAQRWIAVANSNTVLGTLFADTHWKQGRSGQPGGWMQALRRVPGSRVSKNGVSIGNQLQRCTFLPLAAVCPEETDKSDYWDWHGGSAQKRTPPTPPVQDESFEEERW
jgi:hypothetical protein